MCWVTYKVNIHPEGRSLDPKDLIKPNRCKIKCQESTKKMKDAM